MTRRRLHLMYLLAVCALMVYFVSTLRRASQRWSSDKSWSSTSDKIPQRRAKRVFDSLPVPEKTVARAETSVENLQSTPHFKSNSKSQSIKLRGIMDPLAVSIARTSKENTGPHLVHVSAGESPPNDVPNIFINVFNRNRLQDISFSSKFVHRLNSNSKSKIDSRNTKSANSQMIENRTLSRNTLGTQNIIHHQRDTQGLHKHSRDNLSPDARTNVNLNTGLSFEQVPNTFRYKSHQSLSLNLNTHSQTENETPVTSVNHIYTRKDGDIPRDSNDSKPLDSVPNTSGRIHVVTTFTLYSSTIKQAGTDIREQIEERLAEYVQCLKSFTTNQHVKEVHLIYEEPEMVDFVHHRVGVHPKLHLHKVETESSQKALSIHQFAFNHLHNKLVLVTHADIFLDRGFELVDESVIRNRKLMYALSRHEMNAECPGTDFCDTYRGSHDAYIFVPQGTLTPKAIDLLDHRLYDWGTENRIMYVYSKVLGYKVLNPCKIIYIYHRHCSQFRYHMHSRVQVQNFRLLRQPTRSLA